MRPKKPYPSQPSHAIISQPERHNDRTRTHDRPSAAHSDRGRVQELTVMNSALSRQRRQHRLAEIRAQEQELHKRPAKPTADQQPAPTIRDPERLPDPWLFDSEKLLRELDRCREIVLLIPAPTHETHFAINIAVNAIWNLRENLRYLLSLHRDMQQSFAEKGEALTSSQLNPRRDPPTPRYARWEKPARRAKEKESIAPQAGAGHDATA